jgi:hypothetical protein
MLLTGAGGAPALGDKSFPTIARRNYFFAREKVCQSNS